MKKAISSICMMILTIGVLRAEVIECAPQDQVESQKLFRHISSITDKIGSLVACENKICKGDRVLYTKENNMLDEDSYYPGTVIEVFNNGKVMIEPDNRNGATWIVSVSALSVGFRCTDNLCKGDRAIYTEYPGNVIEIFDNGKVIIEPDNFKGAHWTVDASKLGYKVNCYN